MIAAGLLAHGDDVAVAYDRFRDRVMFPIHDRGGKLVAFGGRALDPSARAKYLNSPESELFHKGELLYNHHRARKAAHERGEVIVVEGYVDVIAMTQAGFAHTVAPLGTALTSEQCALLWTIADEPILCFDGDKAGRKAAYRAVDVALPLVGPGKSLRFAMLPEGQDPDDLVRSGGAPAIAEALAPPSRSPSCCSRARRKATPSTRRKNAPASSGGCASSPARSPTTPCAVITRPTWRAGSAIFSALARPPPPGPAGASAIPRGGGRFGRPDPGPRLGLAGAALPAAPRRLVARPREAPREIAILAILICHPGLLEKRVEEVAGLEFAEPRPRRLPRPAPRPARGGLRRGGAAGVGARGGGAGRRPRTHPVAGRRHGQLVVRRS